MIKKLLYIFHDSPSYCISHCESMFNWSLEVPSEKNQDFVIWCPDFRIDPSLEHGLMWL